MEKLNQQDMAQFEIQRRTAPRIILKEDADGSYKSKWSK